MLSGIIKKRIFLALCIMASAIALVTALAWHSLVPFNTKTGFNRIILPFKVEMLNAIQKPRDVVDYAGSTNSHVYFRTKDPGKLFQTDCNLNNGIYIDLRLTKSEMFSSFFRVSVDSPVVNIFAGNFPGVIRTTLDGAIPKITKFSSLFTRAVIISQSSYALRMYEGIDQIFVKVNPTNILLKEKGISQKIGDAGLSTDGSLHYDKHTNNLIYVHYYNNNIFCLDTNLNLIKKFTTIDNFHRTQFEAAQIPSKNLITSKTPRRLANASSSVENGMLYCQSVIKSDNESDNAFSNNSIIDVYSLSTFIYKGSFYLSMYKGERIKWFTIINNSIVAVYKSNLVTFKLPEEMK
jgi:hypothetical protein